MEFNCLIVAPHPDDAEIGMGGTLAALIAAGKKVVLADLTNGEPTPFGTPEKRASEWAAASKILGLQERINLGLTNRELQDNISSRRVVAEVIRKYRPEVLFIPYFEDAHPDHIAASQLVTAARFYAKFEKSDLAYEPYYPRKVIHYFSTHLRVKFEPTFIFDISQHIDAKLAAIRAYRSQFDENPKNRGAIEHIRVNNAFWGQQAGCQFGEPFVCREQVKLSSVEALLNV